MNLILKLALYIYGAGIVISAVDCMWMAKRAAYATQHGQVSLRKLNGSLNYHGERIGLPQK
jgi:hypothetical protein